MPEKRPKIISGRALCRGDAGKRHAYTNLYRLSYCNGPDYSIHFAGLQPPMNKAKDSEILKKL
jgi:hypothetical protein